MTLGYLVPFRLANRTFLPEYWAMAVLILFLCSGATALVYEVLWSKYLSLMFGSTIQAQTVVLAVFMGGLALGNRLFGRRGDTAPRPLAWYGYLEVAIGIYAFFFTNIYEAADQIFIRFGSRLLEHSQLLLVLKGVLSLVLIGIPTTLMGGTLPLLAAWLKRRENEAGRLSARFYSVNSLGAVLGSAIAGFFLIRELGLVASLQATALLNVVIGFMAVALAGKPEKVTSHSVGETPREEIGALETRACCIVALTGAISMGLEVLASRSLSLIFGGSLQSFAIVLMAFILGIGLGSALVASSRFGKRYSQESVSHFILGAGLVIAFMVGTLEAWAILYSQAKSGLAATSMGYIYNQIVISFISLVVLGIPAGLLGSVLPLWIKILSERSQGAGRSVGRLLTWNTLGGVGGVLATGFILMPRLGLRGSIGGLALVLLLTATYMAFVQRRRFSQGLSILAVMLLSAHLAWGGEGWRHVLGSGVFRLRSTEVNSNLMEQRRKFIKILFYEDAADATVSVETSTKKVGNTELVLRINGKPDASTFGDLSTQYLLGHLPLLARPESKNVFVLGFGSGITAGALLGHPLDQITIAENCEPILRAGKLFEPWNRGVLTNSRVKLYGEDARTVLKLSPKQYDVIISEPSNPWVAGIGSVFSREFYELCASRLQSGGVMAQWFHIYEMHDGIVSLVLRTFGMVFPYMEVWDSENGDLIMLGSKTPWPSSPSTYKEIFTREIPRKDLESIGLLTPESIWARQVASQRTAHSIAGEGATQSDGFPVLEYEAPRAFYIGKIATELFIFDERTLQSPLASPEKRTVLRNLSDASLQAIFSQYSSGNSHLVEYLKWRNQAKALNSVEPVYSSAPFFPVAFRGLNTYPATSNLPSGSSKEYTELLNSEVELHTKPENWQASTSRIRSVLDGARTRSKDEFDWVPAYFAGVATKALLENSRPKEALEVADLGLTYEPQDPQLLYLKRVATSLL